MKRSLTISAKCSSCGKETQYELTETETKTYFMYQNGEISGMIQNLFPNVPVWIRSGAIDKKSGGFCICPNCNPFN